MKYMAGFDVGGTKCAVILGFVPQNEEKPRIVAKRSFATADFPDPILCIGNMLSLLDSELAALPDAEIRSVGISCGGPLDPVRGIIQSPPNLPGWCDVPITEIVRAKTGVPVFLQNDANACALAEWRFGAGRGTQNMVFLTFGTGLGAGIIVNGGILNGASGMAGECGHVRLASDGPVGYGKAGSFEGFCSGGGLARQGREAAEKAILSGRPQAWCREREQLDSINARMLADAARHGDEAALKIYHDCGTRLGAGVSVLIDVLNPERIVIGSIFVRCEDLIRPAMEEVISRETLIYNRKVCSVVPAELGEAIGDIAALTIGMDR